jgi:methylated-DNA-[protein]-cysteine S-methyltransferase
MANNDNGRIKSPSENPILHPRGWRIAIRHRLCNISLSVSAGALITSLTLRSNAPAEKYSGPIVTEWAVRIRSFLDGQKTDLSDLPLDFAGRTPFQRRVLNAARAIRWGQTVSYAELAARAGYPRAVRAVASVMRNNDFPLIIPCHRVIAKSGDIGGFMGKKTGAAIDLKRTLLANEGIRVR